jgi:type II secretory pathway component GspD/PulD (secretin)
MGYRKHVPRDGRSARSVHRCSPAPRLAIPTTSAASAAGRLNGTACAASLRAAVQLVGQYLDRPVLFTGRGGGPVILETPHPVPRAEVPRLLESLLDSQNFELVNDSAGGVYRVRPKAPPQPPTEQLPQPNEPPRAGVGNIELFVIPLRHARAEDVAATVNALYGKSAPRADAGMRRGTLGDELRQNQIPPLGM